MVEEEFSYATNDGFIIGKPESLTLHIDIDGLCNYKAIKATYGGVEHTYDPIRLKDALVWLLAPYEIHENPSHECMRREHEEKRAVLLDMRRWDVARRLKALELPESGSHDTLSRIVKTIYDPIGGWTHEACERLRNQLVELIGGERATDVQSFCACDTGDCVRRDMQEEMKPPLILRYDTLGNERHKAVCELQKIPEYPENYNLGDESDAQNDENGDFCKLDHMTITDELRKWASTEVPYKYGNRLHVIADRIDEQFARICEQQKRVLQETIDEMTDELDILRSKNLAVYAHDKVNMYLVLLRDAAREYKELHDDYVELSHDHRELYDFAKAIEQAVKDDNEITLFGVDYTPCDLVEDVDEDMRLINLYHKKFRQLMGEAKSLRDNLAARVEGRDRVRQELEECRKALNEATGNWAKADADCRMYRNLLNDEAKEYVRHKEATDSMYKSFNDVFEAMERLL